MDEKWEKIATLNLKSVRQKFAFKKGWWWRVRSDVERVEREYRQFLYLIVCNPGTTVVPWSRDLDNFWHEHILDTANYAADCDAILGSFIHHNPHLPEGTVLHGKAFAATRRMYKTAFRESVRKGRGRIHGEAGCGSEMPVVFREVSAPAGHHHHSGGHHHDAGGHHAGDHGGGGHSGGHGCGGHGGGHGCGGHGCGGGGHSPNRRLVQIPSAGKMTAVICAGAL